MKYGLISDIHSNALALENVLQEVKKEGIEKLLILGDFVGYYYEPERVFELLAHFDWQAVQGNHESWLSDFLQGDKATIEKYHQSFGSALKIASEQLPRQILAMLISLPPTKEISLDGKKILLAHGAPWDRDQYIYPDAASEVFERISGLGYDYVFLGHTHYAMLQKNKNCIILNPGSLGQPRDKGSQSSWVIADFDKGDFVFKRTTFCPKELIKKAAELDPHHPYLQNVLKR